MQLDESAAGLFPKKQKRNKRSQPGFFPLRQEPAAILLLPGKTLSGDACFRSDSRSFSRGGTKPARFLREPCIFCVDLLYYQQRVKGVDNDMEDRKNLLRMDKLELMRLLEKLTGENAALRARVSSLEGANADLSLAAREAEGQRDSLQAELSDARAQLAALEAERDAAAAIRPADASALLSAPASAPQPQPYAAQEQPYGATAVLSGAGETILTVSSADMPAQPQTPAQPETPVQPETPSRPQTPAPAAAPLDALPVGSFAEATVRAQEIVERTQKAADEYLARCRSEYDARHDDADRLLADARTRAENLLRDAQTRRDALAAQEKQIRERLLAEAERLNSLLGALDGGSGAAGENGHERE